MGYRALSAKLLVCWRLARPFTLLAPAVGVLSGAAMAFGSGAVTAGTEEVILRLLFGCLAAVLLTAASNVLNQICDLELDRINHPHRPLPAGEMGRRAALAGCVPLSLLSLGLAWGAGSREAPWALGSAPLLIAVSVGVATVAYSAPPLRLRRFGWTAQTTIAVSRGLLLPPFGWACVAPIQQSGEAWCVGLLLCVYLVGASATKDFGDQEGDRLAGCRSLPIRFGPQSAARRIRPFLFLPWIALAACAPCLSVHRPTLVTVGVFLARYGAWSGARLVAEPGARTAAGRHPVWMHMYAQLLLAQAGVAAAFLLA